MRSLQAVKQPRSPDRKLIGMREAGGRELPKGQQTRGASGRGPDSGSDGKGARGLCVFPNIEVLFGVNKIDLKYKEVASFAESSSYLY